MAKFSCSLMPSLRLSNEQICEIGSYDKVSIKKMQHSIAFATAQLLLLMSSIAIADEINCYCPIAIADEINWSSLGILLLQYPGLSSSYLLLSVLHNQCLMASLLNHAFCMMIFSWIALAEASLCICEDFSPPRFQHTALNKGPHIRPESWNNKWSGCVGLPAESSPWCTWSLQWDAQESSCIHHCLGKQLLKCC